VRFWGIPKGNLKALKIKAFIQVLNRNREPSPVLLKIRMREMRFVQRGIFSDLPSKLLAKKHKKMVKLLKFKDI